MKPRLQPVIEPSVVQGAVADGRRRQAASGAIGVQFGDDGVGHARQYANWHIKMQVPIDTLSDVPFGTLSRGMANDFRNALIWHMDAHGTTIADLVTRTGVSRDVINKLKKREASTTTVENAMLIAAFYGKTVNQFILKQDVSPSERAQNLFAMLQPEETQLLEAQMRGLLAERARKQG